MYYQTLAVTGRGVFPTDMLRYDRCWPMTQDDIVPMASTAFNGTRRIQLARYVDTKKEQPTFSRWNSFGWTVEIRSINTVKR